ncbi:MAG: outer membrane beta-barrel protein [Nitrospirae bacterium]|nr:outer membrane beta-barrel protein [Nitrospirota bacterium]
MKITRLTRRFVITSLLTVLVPIVLFAPQAYAETYVAGQFGVTLPQSLSNGEQGTLTFSNPNGSATSPSLSGIHQRIITWDADLIFRYPGYRLQPYIGIGPSFYFAELKGPDAPPGQSATSIGFNTEGGVQYYLTRQWTLFGEGKYNYARMNYSSNHSDPNADPFGFRATYSAFTLSIGIGYHF